MLWQADPKNVCTRQARGMDDDTIEQISIPVAVPWTRLDQAYGWLMRLRLRGSTRRGGAHGLPRRRDRYKTNAVRPLLGNNGPESKLEVILVPRPLMVT